LTLPPEVLNSKNNNEKIEVLKELISSYLYKEILEFEDVRNSRVLFDLIKALAFQIGSEVSFTELSSKLGIDKKTVERYIDLLEKAYVVFRVGPYTNNKRRAIKKHSKYYFYDLGIRNAVINNFNDINFRNDLGELFENLCMVERKKYNEYHRLNTNQYFLRTYDGAEIDLIEENNGKLNAYEFKLTKKITKDKSKDWNSFKVINKENLWNFS